jgi:methylated-DNA-[protein]-cysteine S-methyltransferase
MSVGLQGKLKNMFEVYTKNIDGIWFGVVVERQKVAASTFGSEEEKILAEFSKIFRSTPLKLDSMLSDFAEEAILTMRDIRDGKDTFEAVPLWMDRLPAYTQRVLSTVSKIPIGYVASYGGIAEAIGGGARAVGNAMATNRFAPFVPCHRVVTSTLGLGGYGGGLRAKFEFLTRERRGFKDPKEVIVENGSLIVFPVELVLQKLDNPNFFRQTNQKLREL